jgi:hypothetical protein
MSHQSAVSLDDFLSTHGIMENALDKRVNERAKRVADLAKTLTKKHAPSKRKPRPAAQTYTARMSRGRKRSVW